MDTKDNLESQPYIESLTNFLVKSDFEDLPGDVIEQARLVLLDTLGVMLAASPTRYSAARIITQFVESLGGTPESTIVGHPFKSSAVNAALANGTLGYYADMEPFHRGAIVHGAAVVIPTVLAVGERERVHGKRFLTAIVLGIDVACRVSYALNPRSLYARGFHPSAVAGTFGATAAAGYLLDLDVPQFRNAFGLAGNQTAGLLAWADDRTENSRPFNIGSAARNGVTAALLSKMDFGGPPDIFEGKYDLFQAFTSERHLHELTTGLGDRFSIREMVFKRYACCGFLHPGLDGLLKIAAEQQLEIEDVAKITLHFAESGVPVIDNNPLKSHRAQYILPVALLDKRVILDHILPEGQTDPRVQALSERVSLIGDPELDKTFPDQRRSIIEVVTKDGKRFVEHIDWPKGHPENPLGSLEVEEKFMGMATTVLSSHKAAKIVAMVRNIAGVPDSRQLAGLLQVNN